MNLLDIPIRTSTGTIPFRISAQCNDAIIDEISRILSIPAGPADLSIHAPVLLSAPPDNASESRIQTEIAIFHIYRLEGNTIGLYPDSQEDSRIARTWRGVLLFSVLDSILRGNPHCFLHGSVLKHRDNTVTILFGESGIGKSTTARRYREAGGDVVCDDQMLLHLHTDNTLTVSAFPTWSRIKPSCPGTNETYDVRTEYKIRRFCRLFRDSDREYLTTDSGRDFQIRLLKELTAHTYKLLNVLSEQDRIVFGPHFLHFFDIIMAQWSPEILYANLNANLADTLSID